MTSADEPIEPTIEGLDPALTSFFGREQELEDIGRLLGDSRLVTAHGPTGIGKTRLAEAAAVRLWPAYEHGVAFVDLTLLPSPALLARVIGEKLPERLRDNSKRSGDESLVLVLKKLDPSKRLLIVLDNCEDVAPTVAELCVTILKAAPAVRFLATSRIPLGVPDEQLFPVPPLSLPVAMRLLAVRATRAAHTFALTDANNAAVSGLCEDLDCTPLALELAAASLGTFTPEDLRAHIDTITPPIAPIGRRRTGHESVAAMVSVTWQDCTPEEQALWMRLCQLVGHWDVEAAVAVGACDQVPADQVLTVLSGLVMRRVVANDRPNTMTPYRMPEVFRRAGQRRADVVDGLADAVRRRHAEHFAGVVALAVQCYYTEHEEFGLSSVGAHLPNVRLALLTCTRMHVLRKTGLSMATALAGILAWWFHGSLSEGVMWLQLMCAANPEPSAARVIALAQQAFFITCRGDHEEAALLLKQTRHVLAECQASLGTEPEVGSDSDLAYAAAMLAGIYGAHRWLSGEPDSVDLLLAASDDLRVLGHPGPAYFFRNLALYSGARYAKDRPQEMLRLADWLLRDSQAHGDPVMNGSWAMATAGLNQLLFGDHVRAVELLREALRRQLAVHDQWGPGLVGLQLAEALAVTGQVDAAASVLRASELLVERSGMRLEDMEPLAEGAQNASQLVARALGGTALLELVIEDPEATLMAFVNPKVTRPSRREMQVAALIADPRPLTYASIAQELGVAEKTVQTYVDRLKAKLNLSSPAQIARWYRQHQGEAH